MKDHVEVGHLTKYYAFRMNRHQFMDGGGVSHMKQMGMLVVSFRGVKFWILVSLGVFQAKHQYFMPPRSRLGLREETQNYVNRNGSQIFLRFMTKKTTFR